MFSWLRSRRRRKLLEDPFPPWRDAILARNVGHYPRLAPAEAAKLRDATRILVAEKIWEGCGGMHVTDEVKLTIAAQAALLLLGPDHDYFARVPSIVVYPGAFRTPVAGDDWEDDGLGENELSGQAVDRGPVILAWSDVLAEGRDPAGGYNVVVHEFAHQLDFLDGDHNGTPPLADRAAEDAWKRVMAAALAGHQKAVDADEETFFSPDAAADETEFFADAAEAFYCRPMDLFELHPAVFELLQGYFRIDPRAWFPE